MLNAFTEVAWKTRPQTRWRLHFSPVVLAFLVLDTAAICGRCPRGVRKVGPDCSSDPIRLALLGLGHRTAPANLHLVFELLHPRLQSADLSRHEGQWGPGATWS